MTTAEELKLRACYTTTLYLHKPRALREEENVEDEHELEEEEEEEEEEQEEEKEEEEEQEEEEEDEEEEARGGTSLRPARPPASPRG